MERKEKTGVVVVVEEKYEKISGNSFRQCKREEVSLLIAFFVYVGDI